LETAIKRKLPPPSNSSAINVIFYHFNTFSLTADFSCLIIRWTTNRATILIMAIPHITKALPKIGSPFLIQKTFITMVFKTSTPFTSRALGLSIITKARPTPSMEWPTTKRGYISPLNRGRGRKGLGQMTWNWIREVRQGSKCILPRSFHRYRRGALGGTINRLNITVTLFLTKGIDRRYLG
jgi:hypothetical protein